MKRTVTILTLCLLLLLTACGQKTVTTVYDVEHNGVVYTVDKQNDTISDGEHTYQIEVSETGAAATVIYPDGSSYWWSYGNNVSHGGWSDDYDEDKYVPGGTLLDIYFPVNPASRKDTSGNPLMGLLLLAVGLFNAITPNTSWYLSHGWKYKDAEPSEAALFFTRGGGILAILIGLLLFFV